MLGQELLFAFKSEELAIRNVSFDHRIGSPLPVAFQIHEGDAFVSQIGGCGASPTVCGIPFWEYTKQFTGFDGEFPNGGFPVLESRYCACFGRFLRNLEVAGYLGEILEQYFSNRSV